MAIIPLQVASRSLDVASAPNYPSSSPVGAAVQNLGGSLTEFAAVKRQEQEQHDKFLEATAAQELDAAVDGLVADSITQAPLDGRGLRSSVAGDFDPQSNRSTPGAIDKLFEDYQQRVPRSQQERFRARLPEARLRAANRLTGAEYQLGQQFYATETKKVQDNLLNQILMADPRDKATFDSFKRRGLEVIQASGLRDKQSAIDAWNGNAATAFYQAALTKDPKSAPELLGKLGFAPVARPFAGSPEKGKRVSQAMSFYQGRGYTKEQAAGIVGNLLAESSLNTGARNGGDGADGSDSIGIGQWNSDRAKALKAFAAANRSDWRDFGIQLAFVDHELRNSEGAAGKSLRAAKDVRSATEAMIMYERPAGSQNGPQNAHNYSGRLSFAEQAAGVEATGAPDPTFTDIPPDIRLQLAKQTEAQIARNSADYAGGLSDYTAFLRDGNDPDDNGTYSTGELFRNMPADQAAGAQAQIEAARAYGADKNALAFASPGEVQSIFAEREAAAATPEGFRQEAQDIGGLQDVLAARNKVIVADPAAYVLRQPAIAQAASGLNERSEPSATMEYASATLAEQSRLGVPAEAQRILTLSQNKAIADRFNDQATGTQSAATMMRNLEEQWGANWPRVFGELAAKKALPGTALVIGAMNRPDQARAAEALAAAAKVGTAELEKTITSPNKKALTDQLDTEMADFAATLVNNGAGGVTTFNTFQEGVYQLALSYARSEAPEAAATRAFADVLGRKYTFADTYRVPKELDADEIGDNAESIIERLTGNGLLVPVSGLDEAQTREAYLTQVKANGFWVTSGDETGLTLFDETGAVVMKQDGRPVSFTWADILANGSARNLRITDVDPATIAAPMLAPPPPPISAQGSDYERQLLENRARQMGQFGVSRP